MPVVPERPTRAAGSHDQADPAARNHAVCLGASRRREVRRPIEAALSPLSGVLFHDRDVSVGLISYHFPASHQAGQYRGFGSAPCQEQETVTFIGLGSAPVCAVHCGFLRDKSYLLLPIFRIAPARRSMKSFIQESSCGVEALGLSSPSCMI